MDALKSWAVSVIISAVAGTVISLLMPKGSMEKTMRAVIGVFMVSAVCLPLAQINIGGETEQVFLPVTVCESNAEDIEEYMLTVCRNAVESAVDSAARESGVADYKIIADISCDEYGCIIIHEITVEIDKENTVSEDAFETLLNQKLGVPVSVRKGN